MKRLKKWLFPLLTCLIAAGAAVLPPYLSQLRDVGQFGQIHVEGLAADALPVREPLNLLERLALYARWQGQAEPVPSFQSPEAGEDREGERAERANLVLELLVQAGVLPAHLIQSPLKSADMTRILLWETADGIGREPVEFWKAAGDLGDGSFWVTFDGESGLPLELHLYDPDMAQWLAYKEPDTLPDLAEQYFALLGLEVDLVEPHFPANSAPWERQFAVAETGIVYWVSFNATTLDIDMEPSRMNAYTDYDG